MQLKIPLKQLLHLVQEDDDDERFPSAYARTEEHKKRAYALIADITVIQKKKDEQDRKVTNFVNDVDDNRAQDQDGADDKDDYENAAESLEKDAASGHEEEEQVQVHDDKPKSPSPKAEAAPPSSKPASNGQAGGKRGRGRPPKTDKESAKKQKQNE